MCAPVRSGEIGPPVRIAGRDDTAIGQVEWAPDRPDTLYLLTDPDGWWNIHELSLEGTSRPLCSRPEEFGKALWRIGARWFLPAGGGRLFVVHGTSGRQLAVLEADGTLRDIGRPYTEWAAVATDGRRIAATAASPRHRRSVVVVDPDTAAIEVVRAAPLGHATYLPTGIHQVFRGHDGDVHA